MKQHSLNLLCVLDLFQNAGSQLFQILIFYIYIFEQAQSDEEAMLFKKYDEDIYMNDDGTFRTTQPEGIATIQLPQHGSSADISPENKPIFQVML